MRERRNFGVRTRDKKDREPHRKYFLVFEGEKTEKIYFDKVIECRKSLNINDLLDLIPIEREYYEQGTSNPKKLVEIFIEDVNLSEVEDISREKLLGWIMGDLIDKCSFLDKENVKEKIWFNLKAIGQKLWGDDLSRKINKDNIDSDCQEIISSLISRMDKQFSWPEIVINIGEGIALNHNITYDPELDKVCFIVDRDRKSFKEDQYRETMEICKKNKYGFYVSNPCFEFWLLLHFQESRNLSDEEKKKLLENKKSYGNRKTPRRTYAENKLRGLLAGYTKNNYDVAKIISRVPDAIENEKMFCEDEALLINEVGSRIGILFQELRV